MARFSDFLRRCAVARAGTSVRTAITGPAPAVARRIINVEVFTVRAVRPVRPAHFSRRPAAFGKKAALIVQSPKGGLIFAAATD